MKTLISIIVLFFSPSLFAEATSQLPKCQSAWIVIKTDLVYHPEIDGLRAIAVVLVILFHINSQIFSFGYLGVDIFFVISGFVISQSLYKDYFKNQKISIINFYTRRFKRLYPALMTVIFVTAILYSLESRLEFLYSLIFQ